MSDNLTPTIQSVLNHIRSRVIDGTYGIGSPLPSENDLAGQLRVSRGSVRRAIEHLLEAGELSRQRHSRPSVARRASQIPDEEQTDVYVWMAGTVRDSTSVPFLQGVSAELAGTRYRMVAREPSFFVGEVVRTDEGKFLNDLLRKPHVAGAIVWRDVWADHSEAVAELLQRGMPLVFVDSPAPAGIQTDHVGTTNRHAAKRCVRHLLNQGHRRIVCVTDSDVASTIADRIDGYWAAMRQAGYGAPGHEDMFARVMMPSADSQNDPCDEPIAGVFAPMLGQSPFYSKLTHRLVHEILALDPRPTALFITYDILAYWICAVLEGQGIRIPEDMSIVGFDWRAQWNAKVPDFIDTASQDFEGFGRHAVSLLLDRFEGHAPPVARQVLLDAPLVVRSSSARLVHSRPYQTMAAFAPG